MATRCDGDDRAFVDKEDGCMIHPGLTKREYFAGLALMGLLADPNTTDIGFASKTAVASAELLIAELNRKAGE